MSDNNADNKIDKVKEDSEKTTLADKDLENVLGGIGGIGGIGGNGGTGGVWGNGGNGGNG